MKNVQQVNEMKIHPPPFGSTAACLPVVKHFCRNLVPLFEYRTQRCGKCLAPSNPTIQLQAAQDYELRVRPQQTKIYEYRLQRCTEFSQKTLNRHVTGYLGNVTYVFNSKVCCTHSYVLISVVCGEQLMIDQKNTKERGDSNGWKCAFQHVWGLVFVIGRKHAFDTRSSMITLLCVEPPAFLSSFVPLTEIDHKNMDIAPGWKYTYHHQFKTICSL